uniref:CMP/dCMP-type deaminase domain-containing protein n=1 Tax=Astyanax mexicanus TaxID=7994 RepID=A0A8B9GRU9_ASTMX
MGLSGSLRALVLLSLLAVGCRSAKPDPGKVDIDALADIIKFFDDNYKKLEKKEVVRQYAVAINVAEKQCKENFAPDDRNFLTNESLTHDQIKSKIYDENVALYEGQELIAAGTLKKRKYNRHSESILMNPTDCSESSPMTKLLNKTKDGCVVFYTYNSPCAQTCTNTSSPYNILGALEEWRKRGGLKAFVFQKIWKYDENKAYLEEVFKAITQYVPLYRCLPSKGCYECVQKGNINQNGVQSGNINQDCVQSGNINHVST